MHFEPANYGFTCINRGLFAHHAALKVPAVIVSINRAGFSWWGLLKSGPEYKARHIENVKTWFYIQNQVNPSLLHDSVTGDGATVIKAPAAGKQR